jgi:uncharacterized protein (TIGR02284 family)
MDRDEVIELLNELIERNKDSAKGFMRAEHDVISDDLSSYFGELAAERAELVDALEEQVELLGGEPEDHTTAGGVKRGWMKIKAAMTIEHEKTDDVVVTKQAEQEAELVDYYEKILDRDLPLDLKSYLHEQYEQVRKTERKLAALEQETSTRAE